MKSLALLFSHSLTEDQKKDAYENLGVEKVISLPKDLQEIWSNIPKDSSRICNVFIDFITENCNKGDYILVEGEYGMVFSMSNWALKEGYVPIYSYTKREYKKEVLEDGTIKNIHMFKHICYKFYKIEG